MGVVPRRPPCRPLSFESVDVWAAMSPPSRGWICDYCQSENELQKRRCAECGAQIKGQGRQVYFVDVGEMSPEGARRAIERARERLERRNT